jgi:murein DD-endopeptidase MepM/ murein hydrolase activator NlpD
LIALIGISIIGELAWSASAVPTRSVATPQRAAAWLPHSEVGLAIPVTGVERMALRDSFTAKRKGHIHAAIDILAPRGTPVVSAADGIVTKLRWSGAGGNTVYINDPQNTEYYYAHLDHYASSLREGMQVHRGDVIAYVGTTGNAPPQTPHLHFAIEQNGMVVDPYPILLARGETLR